MNIYIDESGSFVHDVGAGKWNIVAALAVAESSRRALAQLMAALRKSVNANPGSEVKIHQVPEGPYLRFLEGLSGLDLVLFFVATDAGLGTVENVRQHQHVQAANIEMHVDRMKYEEGRQAVQVLAHELRRLAPQLYVQLMCQINLMFDVLARSTMYFVQRRPATLGSFRWRIDRKGVSKTDFERVFEQLSPALIQTMSMRRPMAHIEGCDYSHMQRYQFAPGDEPTYLKRHYGIEVGSSWNLGKLLLEDMQFVDSKLLDGVQAIDLVASGIRRCLRANFSDPIRVARQLGALTVQSSKGKLPFRLMLFGVESDLEEPTAKLVRAMGRNTKAMLVK